MNSLSTLFLALSMSSDAFAVAIGKGAELRHPKPVEALRIGVIFGSVEATMPLIGWALGSLASGLVAAFDHWLAFIILFALGIKMLVDGVKGHDENEKPSQHQLGALVFAAVGSSIDALGVGVTLAFIDANIWVTALAIGTATFLMATLGIMIGHLIGAKAGKIAEIAGGVILIMIGTKILLEHTGYIQQLFV